MIARVLTAAIGVWLMASPAILGYGRPAATNAWIFGPTIAAVSLIAAAQVMRATRWVNLPLGAWLVVAPFVLSYESDARLNSIVSGGLVVALCFVRGKVNHRYAGGWSALFRDDPSQADAT